MKKILIPLLLVAFIPLYAQQTESVTKIWDIGPHNAFTDLVWYKGHFYCTFREAPGHVPHGTEENGKVRIIRSKDGKSWEKIALLSDQKYDLRDPKLSVTPAGQLMVLMGGSDYTSGSLGGCRTHVSFSSDGKRFSQPQPTLIEAGSSSDFDWIWRITWHENTGYGVVYQSHQHNGEINTLLLKTGDGIHYEPICDLKLTGKPNEATIRFEKDNMFMVIRREAPGANGLIGEAQPPYISWKWTDLGMRIGGPEFAFIGKDRIAMGTRLYRSAEEGGVKTGIVLMNTLADIDQIIELPSGGDTSYPGMVIRKGKIYMSYYSSHEGKTSIYFVVTKAPK